MRSLKMIVGLKNNTSLKNALSIQSNEIGFKFILTNYIH